MKSALVGDRPDDDGREEAVAEQRYPEVHVEGRHQHARSQSDPIEARAVSSRDVRKDGRREFPLRLFFIFQRVYELGTWRKHSALRLLPLHRRRRRHRYGRGATQCARDHRSCGAERPTPGEVVPVHPRSSHCSYASGCRNYARDP